MDLLSLIVLAAEQAGTEEHDKTAFYAAGGLLAAWAVIVSAIGLTKHDFPSAKGARNGVIGIGLVLMAAVMAATMLTA